MVPRCLLITGAGWTGRTDLQFKNFLVAILHLSQEASCLIVFICILYSIGNQNTKWITKLCSRRKIWLQLARACARERERERGRGSIISSIFEREAASLVLSRCLLHYRAFRLTFHRFCSSRSYYSKLPDHNKPLLEIGNPNRALPLLVILDEVTIWQINALKLGTSKLQK